jgi:hypothetical protein
VNTKHFIRQFTARNLSVVDDGDPSVTTSRRLDDTELRIAAANDKDMRLCT